MTEEIEDGFTRLKELAELINKNISDSKLNLAQAQLRKLIADIDVLESEMFLEDN